MIRELATGTDTSVWVIGAMVFFIAVFAFVCAHVVTQSKSAVERHARLPLDDAEPSKELSSGTDNVESPVS